MCAGAVLQARLGEVVYGAPNPLMGAAGSWVQLLPAAVLSRGDYSNDPDGDDKTNEESSPSSGAAEQRQDAGPLRPVGQHPFHTQLQVSLNKRQ